MRKIGKVIACCEDCEFAKRYNDPAANHGCVLVCRQTRRVVDMDDINGHNHRIEGIPIPSDCPLEGYTGNAEIYE